MSFKYPKFHVLVHAATCFILLLSLYASALYAVEGEIRVDGELVPAELFNGFHVHQTATENYCPPHSDIRERDKLLANFIRVKVAEERSMKLDDRTLEQMAGYQEEISSDQAQNNSEYRNKYLWLELNTKANNYWSSTIGKLGDEEVKAQYDKLVANKDPRFVDAPLYKLMIMQTSDEQYLDQLADRLRSGETWNQVSKDVDPLDWNSHNKDMWFTADRLDKYNSKAFHALDIDVTALDRNDVIGPLSEVKSHRLIVILDKTVEPVIPFDATLMNLKGWAASEVRGDMYRQRHNELNASLIETVEITQDNQPITIALEHNRCPS